MNEFFGLKSLRNSEENKGGHNLCDWGDGLLRSPYSPFVKTEVKEC